MHLHTKRDPCKMPRRARVSGRKGCDEVAFTLKERLRFSGVAVTLRSYHEHGRGGGLGKSYYAACKCAGDVSFATRHPLVATFRVLRAIWPPNIRSEWRSSLGRRNLL